MEPNGEVAADELARAELYERDYDKSLDENMRYEDEGPVAPKAHSMTHNELTKYKVTTFGDRYIACEALPLIGPLNQFGVRTPIDIADNTEIYLAADVDKVLEDLQKRIGQVLEVQDALKAQTVRIRNAALGDKPERAGIDTEEIVRQLQADLARVTAELEKFKAAIAASDPISPDGLDEKRCAFCENPQPDNGKPFIHHDSCLYKLVKPCSGHAPNRRRQDGGGIDMQTGHIKRFQRKRFALLNILMFRKMARKLCG